MILRFLLLEVLGAACMGPSPDWQVAKGQEGGTAHKQGLTQAVVSMPPTVTLSGTVPLPLSPLLFTEPPLIPRKCRLVGDVLPGANRWGLSPQFSS